MAIATRRLLVATTASASINSNSSSAADSPQPSVSVESDFVVIIAALLCALICVFGLFAVARCAWLRNFTNTTTTTTTTAQSSYSAAGSANKGIKKKILHSYPKFVFDSNCHSSSTDGSGGGGGGLDDCCAICLAEFVDGDEIRVLPHCGHGFHAGCVDTWLSRRSSCPSCRRILVGGKNICQNCGHFPSSIMHL